jgi:hypothetical protein
MIHEAKLHTNREIMVREQEMLLEDLAAFVLAMNTASQATNISSPNSPDWLHGTLPPHTHMQQQQQQGMQGQQLMYLHQQQVDGQQMQQQEVLQLLQQQQQQQAGGVGGLGGRSHSGQVAGLMQVIRGWTVQNMLDQVFPVSRGKQQRCSCQCCCFPGEKVKLQVTYAMYQSKENVTKRRMNPRGRHGK